MAYTSVSSYGSNPNAGQNPNEDHGWGNYKWPSGVPSVLLATATYKDIHVTVRRELVELFQLAFAVTDVMGYTIYAKNPDGSGEVWGPWSYENRPIGGTSVPSNHSRGKAIDINAPQNPQSRTFSSNIPPAVIAAWERMGFYWGGRYTGAKYDTMHLEYCYPPDYVARHVDVAHTLLRTYGAGANINVGGVVINIPVPVPAPLPVPAPDPTPTYPGLLVRGSKGDAVRTLQRRLNAHLVNAGGKAIGVDGDFGPATEGAVKWYQTCRHGAPYNLDIDGKCGPRTWGTLWH